MRVGVTGHRHRPGIDWAWVAEAVKRELAALGGPIEGVTSLAAGADQVFARAVLDLGGRLTYVRPQADYDRHFEGEDLVELSRLSALASIIDIVPTETDEDAYLDAGVRMLSESEVLFAVWDGKPAAGRGGTGEVVALAQALGRPVVWIEPLARTISRL